MGNWTATRPTTLTPDRARGDCATASRPGSPDVSSSGAPSAWASASGCSRPPPVSPASCGRRRPVGFAGPIVVGHARRPHGHAGRARHEPARRRSGLRPPGQGLRPAARSRARPDRRGEPRRATARRQRPGALRSAARTSAVGRTSAPRTRSSSVACHQSRYDRLGTKIALRSGASRHGLASRPRSRTAS